MINPFDSIRFHGLHWPLIHSWRQNPHQNGSVTSPVWASARVCVCVYSSGVWVHKKPKMPSLTGGKNLIELEMKFLPHRLTCSSIFVRWDVCDMARLIYDRVKYQSSWEVEVFFFCFFLISLAMTETMRTHYVTVGPSGPSVSARDACVCVREREVCSFLVRNRWLIE